MGAAMFSCVVVLYLGNDIGMAGAAFRWERSRLIIFFSH